MEKWIFFCWLAINVLAFLAMGLDKWKAKRQGARRIRERTLLGLAAIGGSLGGLLGMRLFHHKTLHKQFRYGLPAMLLLHLALGLWIWIRWL